MRIAVFHRGGIGIAVTVLVGAAIALLLALAPSPQQARASSHREAPLISNDPTADNTDLYAFRSPGRPDTATMIAHYIPFEEPTGGPKLFNFDANALHELQVENNC